MLVTTKIDLVLESKEDMRELEAEMAELDVSVYLVNESGPGGGWPEVALTGELESVRAALIVLGEDEDMATYMTI